MAQSNWPNRPFRFLVGNSPGSAPDIVARLFGDAMSRALGQAWAVENRPGADGLIAAETVARSPADGYALLLGSQGPMAIDMHLKKSLPVDSLKDFTHVAVVVDETTGMAIAVHPSLTIKTLPELVSYAKANPNKLSFSTTVAYGTMFGAWLAKTAVIDMVEVRYKVAAQALQDAVAGRVQVAYQSPAALGPHVKSGALRFISVATARRIPEWGEVPTVAETYANFSMRGFMILAGPAGIPRDVVARLNKEAAVIAKDAKFREELGKIFWYNFEGARTPEGTTEFVRRERETWGAFVRSIGLKAE
ncbi:MAG: Bug family tripartite tricarboxylate transporter substrate binding protein [Burkholderiales bacterium]